MRCVISLLIPVYLIHVLVCPFTKVEESFNVQAVHDILNYKFNTTKFDNLQFPGVVPRTFTAPLLLSALSSPFVSFINFLGVLKCHQQMIIRIIIGCLMFCAQKMFFDSLKYCFGRSTSYFYVMITISQFHINFYSTRPLPNVFALIIALISISFYLKKNYKCFVMTAGIGILLLRSELSILFGVMLLLIIIRKRFSVRTLIITAAVTVLISLPISISIDSYFWKRFVWPEAEVFIFNTIMNRSAQWGTHPFLWYFYSALPRCLLTSIVLTSINCIYNRTHKTTEICIIAFIFILTYSLLPHKELRFIFYVIPIMNAAAAYFWHSMYDKSIKSKLCNLIYKFLWLLWVTNIIFTLFMLMISYFNYPGGKAISSLNAIENLKEKGVHVHICNLAAQTGVTRFYEQHENWIYNKTENIDGNADAMSIFTHVILESYRRTEFELMMTNFRNISYKSLGVVYGFSKLSKSWPFYELQPSLVMLEKNHF